MLYLVQSASGKAGAASAQLSSHRGLQDGCIHKYCSRSTLPVENNSGKNDGSNDTSRILQEGVKNHLWDLRQA